MNLKKIYYNSMSWLVGRAVSAIGEINITSPNKYLKYSDYLNVASVIKDGDIILARTSGHLSNVVIPGFWKHAAIYCGCERIIEAVNPYVRMDRLINLVMHTNNIAIKRIPNITERQINTLREFAVSRIGKKYDKGLRIWDEKEDFCSEILYHGINNAMEFQYVELKYRMGYPTFSPNDCYLDDEKFETILEIRR